MNKKICFLFVFLLCFQAIFWGGCWDSRELDKLFLVTGIGVDKFDDQNLELTLQVGKTQPTASQTGAGSGGSSTPSPVNFSKVGRSILPSFTHVSLDSSRALVVDHNQIMLFGEALAQQGIKEHLDIFIRVPEARIEVPILIVKGGTAKQVLEAKFEENDFSSIYCSKFLDGLETVSSHLKMRLIDVMQRMLFDNFACAITAVELKEKNQQQTLEYAGIAALKQGVLQGYLSMEETLGYLLIMGKVSNEIISVQSPKGLANFRIQKNKVNKKLSPKNGSFELELQINCALELEEIVGFETTPPKDLIKEVNVLAVEKIKQLTTMALQKAKQYQTDIFGFGLDIYKKQPETWKEIKQNWDALFASITEKMDVKVTIPTTGDIVQTIDIEKNVN